MITDHALLRYIERVKGIDLSFVRNELMDIIRDPVRAGAASLKKDGFTYILEDGAVITVKSTKPPKPPKVRYKDKK